MRKQKCILLLLLSIILIQSYFMSVASSTDSNHGTDSWASFHHDPSHSGTTIDDITKSSAKLLWAFTTMDVVSSSSSVAAGRVFAGSNDGAVYCLNSTNGELLWYYSTRSKVESSPAINNGYVYVGCDDGNLYALNATSGLKLWNFLTGGEVYSSPAVVSSVVYVGSYDGNIYALNATSGTKLWSYNTGNNVFSSPAVVSGVVYVASNNFFVYALNASTGNEIWRSQTGNTISSPCVSSDYLYIGSYDGYVYGLNISTGAEIWKYQTDGAVTSSPAVAYGSVYVGSEDNNVYCLNASNGKKIWQSPTGYWVTSSPAVSDGNVYVGSKDYSFYCLNASTGTKKWSYETGNFVDSSPAIVNGTLYLGSDDNHIYAFALFNSTPEIVPLQHTKSLAWTTMAFDVIACAVGGVIIFAILFFVRSTRRAEQNAEATTISHQNLFWLSLHIDTLCIFAILAFSIIFFINLGSGSLWAADEQTYSQWAFHMVKNGDYLNPWTFGITNFWIGKPPFNMWLMSLAYQLFGVNNFALRVWSAVFGTLSLVLVFYLGKKLFNPYVGFLSAIVLGTFTTFYSFARHAMTDVPFIFFTLASIYFLLLSESTEKTNRYAALSGLFFGLALMTKQFEALLIPLIGLVYLLATTRRISFLFADRFAFFWGVGLLVFSPWLIYMSIIFGSEFWRGFFVFNVLMRMIGPVEGHVGGYLFYFSNLVNNESLFWVILLPFAAGLCIFNSVIKRLKEDTLILAWMSMVLLVFTFAQTKLYWYILPAFPAFAIAISNFLYQISKKILSCTLTHL
jgi:outer membrane protein assembly factor BamB